MKIIIDTNIFYNNWNFSSAMFQVLANFIGNTSGNTLCIPFVIIKESQNKYKEEMSKIEKDLSHLKLKLQRLQGFEFYTDEIDDSLKKFDFEAELLKTFPNTKILSSDYVNNDLLLDKAIHSKRPFRDNEKGYRDALLWNCLTQYLKCEAVTDSVTIITNNSHDFMERISDDYELHRDLKDDLKYLGLNNDIYVYNSLSSFITGNVDEKLHGYSHKNIEEIESRFLDEVEELFESYTSMHMDDLNKDYYANLFDAAGLNGYLVKLCKEVEFDVVEGTEDPSIYSGYLLPNNKFAFEYSYNFRVCSIKFYIETGIYHKNQDAISRDFQNVEIGPTVTKFYSYSRAYFYGSGVIDLTNGDIDEVNIDEIHLKIK